MVYIRIKGMEQKDFDGIVKRYAIDVTLRKAGESYEDFIARAIRDGLGEHIYVNKEKK